MTVGGLLHVEWKDADVRGPLTIRTLRKTAEASHHLIRLDGAEKLHVHEGRDVTIVVLEGKARMRLAEQDMEIKAGDVIEIPRGVPHKAESLQKPVVVYAIFTPPNDPADYREVIL